MTPEHATLFLGFVLPAFTQEHATTKRVIEAIPADRTDYRPDSISRATIDLAWHIVSAEKRFLTAVANGVFDFTPMPRPEEMNTAAPIAAWFDDMFASTVPKLKALSGEQLAKVIDFRGILQLPAVAFVQIGMSHTIHHRGQLSVHLRTMGAAVPSIYGETYEMAQAKAAKEAQR
jgi:uncharacterized damage-inducible protein DinB